MEDVSSNMSGARSIAPPACPYMTGDTRFDATASCRARDSLSAIARRVCKRAPTATPATHSEHIAISPMTGLLRNSLAASARVWIKIPSKVGGGDNGGGGDGGGGDGGGENGEYDGGGDVGGSGGGLGGGGGDGNGGGGDGDGGMGWW